MTTARKASDGPALAEAGPALAHSTGAAAGELAGPGRAAGRAAGGSSSGQPSSARVLADRIAAALVHHEPGWRLPRHTALARRYNVSTTEIDTALADLAARHLVRRLPDGQFYRASPAEYLIPLEGMLGLASHVDPMGGQIACRDQHVSWRRVPEDIGWVLGIAPGDLACVIRLLWAVNGEPAALATTYLARYLAGQAADQEAAPPALLTVLPRLKLPGTADGEGGLAAATADCMSRALSVEMQPPPPSVARSLGLLAGQAAAMVTVLFDDPAEGRPAALTVTVLRPDLFRIVVQSPARPPPDGTEAGLSAARAHALKDWES